MNLRKYLIAFVVCAAVAFVLNTYQLRAQKSDKKPKNVIIMIADGMGRYHIDAANYYQYGDNNSQVYEDFPVSLYMSTYLAKKNDDDAEDWDQGYNSYMAWTDFDYLRHNPTGSAAAATAMSSGKKTYYRAIGVDIDKRPLYNVTEKAKDMNKAAGVITSVQFAHATPAGFSVHNVHRHNYEEIAASMILESKLDVIMGCGHPCFDGDGKPTSSGEYKYVGGKDLWMQLIQNPLQFKLEDDKTRTVADIDADGKPDAWTLIEKREDFVRLTEGNTPKRLIGVPQVAKTLQQERSGDGDADAYEVPFTQTVPDLATMTKTAINVLDNDSDGFFLMIEGGAVDWASHDNQSGRMIEEMIDFNKSVNAVVEWVEASSSWDETLVIVTSDHECGYLCGTDSDPEQMPVVNNGKGEMPGIEWHHDGHTNQLVPFFAKGAGSDMFHLFADEVDMKRGPYINNTEIAQAIFMLWGMD